MSKLQLYSKVYVYINGSLLVQNADVKITRHSGMTPLSTLFRSFAGSAQGNQFIEIAIGNAVPEAGFEYDPGIVEETYGAFVNISLVAGGSTLTTDGNIIEDNLSYAIDSSSKLDITFHGEYANWISQHKNPNPAAAASSFR